MLDCVFCGLGRERRGVVSHCLRLWPVFLKCDESRDEAGDAMRWRRRWLQKCRLSAWRATCYRAVSRLCCGFGCVVVVDAVLQLFVLFQLCFGIV